MDAIAISKLCKLKIQVFYLVLSHKPASSLIGLLTNSLGFVFIVGNCSTRKKISCCTCHKKGHLKMPTSPVMLAKNVALGAPAFHEMTSTYSQTLNG